MKTLKSITLAAATSAVILLFSPNAHAFMNLVPVNIPEKAVVKVMIPENHNASISVYDQKGSVLHFETVKAGGVASKLYDISALGNGIYTFHSVVEYSSTTKKVSLEDDKVEVISKEVEYKPVFSIRNDRLMINYLNEDQREIELMIEGEGRDFASIRDNDMIYQKSIDISNLMSGEYFAKLKVGMNTYAHRFTVN